MDTFDITFITAEPTDETPARYFVQARDEVGTIHYGTTYDTRPDAVLAGNRIADRLAGMGVNVHRSL